MSKESYFQQSRVKIKVSLSRSEGAAYSFKNNNIKKRKQKKNLTGARPGYVVIFVSYPRSKSLRLLFFKGTSHSKTSLKTLV